MLICLLFSGEHEKLQGTPETPERLPGVPKGLESRQYYLEKLPWRLRLSGQLNLLDFLWLKSR